MPSRGLYGEDEQQNALGGQPVTQPGAAPGAGGVAATANVTSAPSFTNFEDVFNTNRGQAKTMADKEAGVVTQDAGGRTGRMDMTGNGRAIRAPGPGNTREGAENYAAGPFGAKPGPAAQPAAAAPTATRGSMASGASRAPTAPPAVQAAASQSTLTGKQSAFDQLSNNFKGPGNSKNPAPATPEAPQLQAYGGGNGTQQIAPPPPDTQGVSQQALEGTPTSGIHIKDAPPSAATTPDGALDSSGMPTQEQNNVAMGFNADGTDPNYVEDQRVTSAQDNLNAAGQVADDYTKNMYEARRDLARKQEADAKAREVEAADQEAYNKTQADVASYGSDGGQALLDKAYGDGAANQWDAGLANRAGAQSQFADFEKHFGGYGDEYARTAADNQKLRQRDINEKQDFITQGEGDAQKVQDQMTAMHGKLDSAQAQVAGENADTAAHIDNSPEGVTNYNKMASEFSKTHKSDGGTATARQMADNWRSVSHWHGDYLGTNAASRQAKDMMIGAGVPSGDTEALFKEFSEGLPDDARAWVDGLIADDAALIQDWHNGTQSGNQDWQDFMKLFTAFLASKGYGGGNTDHGTKRS